MPNEYLQIYSQRVFLFLSDIISTLQSSYFIIKYDYDNIGMPAPIVWELESNFIIKAMKNQSTQMILKVIKWFSHPSVYSPPQN